MVSTFISVKWEGQERGLGQKEMNTRNGGEGEAERRRPVTNDPATKRKPLRDKPLQGRSGRVSGREKTEKESSAGVEEGQRQTRPEDEVEASAFQTGLWGKTWPEGTLCKSRKVRSHEKRDLGSWRGVKAAPGRLDGPGLGRWGVARP